MKHLTIALECIGIIGLVTGIAIEASLQSNIGFIAITAGSVIIATGGLVWSKVYRSE